MDKKDYELAVDAFREADDSYKQLESMFLEGSIIQACCPPPEETNLYSPKQMALYIQESYKSALTALNELRTERNMKLLNAKNAMRAAVALGESQWRGSTGSPTILNYNSFTVASVTRRKLDPDSLLTLVAQKGKLEELMKLTAVNKKDGKAYPAIRNEVTVEYEAVKEWLIDNEMIDVLEAAYDESESTPQVKGPKEVAFLGETKE
jgi:hypothetical protein